jgi:hypothetical protein
MEAGSAPCGCIPLTDGRTSVVIVTIDHINGGEVPNELLVALDGNEMRPSLGLTRAAQLMKFR